MMDYILSALFWGSFLIPIAVIIYLIKNKNTAQQNIKRFAKILAITASSSFIPFGPFGFICGMPAWVLASLLIFLLLDKEG